MNEADHYIILTGDPSSGLNFTGPFDSFDDALQFASENGFGAYEICPLINPEPEETIEAGFYPASVTPR